MSKLSKGSVLVVGGGGYIGAQAALTLVREGFDVCVYDNFTTGNRDLAERTSAKVCYGELADRQALQNVFATACPTAVMHFAALACVGDSMIHPDQYYRNNVSCTLNLLDEMVRCSVQNFIFSSTCATYGVPEKMPIQEAELQRPVNPYGRSKLMVEQILKDYEHAFGLRSVIFRYFNAAGADPEGKIGERHKPETHLIPLAILAALGHGELQVFGQDYSTPDGTCIRDYIHVSDIIKAHMLGLEYLLAGGASDAFNVGTGHGYSVLEVISGVEQASGRPVPRVVKERRAGDPPVLVAGAEKIRASLGWKAEYLELQKIIQTAYDWHVKDLADSTGATR